MRRDGEPLAILPCPAVGIAAMCLLAIRHCVARRRMDDCEVAQHADLHVMRFEVPDRDWLRGLF